MSITAEELDHLERFYAGMPPPDSPPCALVLLLVAEIRRQRAENRALTKANELWQEPLAWIQAVHEAERARTLLGDRPDDALENKEGTE